MPLPVLAMYALGALAVGGVGAGAKGAHDLSQARARSKAATKRHQTAVAKTQGARKRFMDRAGVYGEAQLSVARHTVGGFLRLLDQLGLQGRSREAQVLEELQISPTQLREYRGIVEHAGALAGGALSAATAGTTASAATVGLVGLFASASTGTAIGSLGGAAAQSATLAWLGGGSLASGGGGMALGSTVLGGIVVAPALFVGGVVLATQGQKAKSQAREHERKVAVACAELGALRDFLERAETRVDELESILSALATRAMVA